MHCIFFRLVRLAWDDASLFGWMTLMSEANGREGGKSSHDISKGTSTLPPNYFDCCHSERVRWIMIAMANNAVRRCITVLLDKIIYLLSCIQMDSVGGVV
jgi:hypothetical protein